MNKLISSMASTLFGFFLFVFVVGALGIGVENTGYDKYYDITWGGNHALSLDQGREIQLSMDKSSGSGFGSKSNYGSGFFHLSIKLPGTDSAGVVTAFYLSSQGNHHDELDFEFLGNLEGKPYILQTNVFANGVGNREQRIRLWFDPTAAFHSYKILWNPYQTVFFVDDIPIRVYKNKTNIGVAYPSQPMQILASLWDGSNWATDGGKIKVNWAYAPFKAYFRGFNVHACPSYASTPNSCSSSQRWWWNSRSYMTLDSTQQKAYKYVTHKYMTYDYCFDKSRHPTTPPECVHI